MKILFVTAILPHRRDTGSSLFSQSLIDLMREAGAAVRPVGWQGLDLAEAELEGAVGRRAFVTRQHPAAALAWGARSIVKREPFSIAKFRHPSFDVAVHAQAEWADIVVIDHEMDWVLDLLRPGTKVIHVSHQIASKIYGLRPKHPVYAREVRLLRRVERRLAACADQIWTIAPEDAIDYAAMGAPDVRYLPYTPAACQTSEGDEPPYFDCVLLGTWTWGPNRVGLEWFMDKVLPSLGDLSIAIGGRGSLDYLGAAPNLHALGEVPDAIGFLKSGRAILIPSIAGFGLQTKTLTALSAHRPIVATTLAARHIDELPPHVLIADEREAFASAIRQAVRMEVRQQTDVLAARRHRFREAVLTALADLGSSPQ